MKYFIINILFVVFTIVAACDATNDLAPASADASAGGASGTGGSLARFTINGNTLYTVDNSSLNVFDITSAQTPELKKNIYLNPSSIETIFSRDTTLFIGSQLGMYIYNIKNPVEPVQLSLYEHIISCDPVVAQNNYAYVTLRSSINSSICNRGLNQLDVVNISDLRNPFPEKSYQMVFPLGLGIDDTLLFVCDNGLKVFNAKEVPNLELITEFPITANDVIPTNGLLIVTATEGIYQYSYGNREIELLSIISVNEE